MKYLGSKNRIAKELVPIIQSYITNETNGYLETCVGGANIIDKIICNNKIGIDIQPYLIALLKQTQKDVSIFPQTITNEEYTTVRLNKKDYEDWYVGLVGFCATFGARYFGGYARDKQGNRDITNESIRNLIKQSPNLKDIKFKCCSLFDLPKDKINNYVIYCDIPYRNTTEYNIKTFDYDKFYDWCREMSKTNIVLISEYEMPNDFECIWQKEHIVNFDVNRGNNMENKIRIEKLFVFNKKER